MDKALAIRANTREQYSPVFPLLSALPRVTLEVAPLAAADYVLADRVAVKRKEAADFVASVLDRRVFRQVAKMQGEFERVVLIIEGDLQPYHSILPPDLLRSALAFLAVVKGVTVLPTATPADTAAMLRALASQAHKGLGHEVSYRAGKPRPADPSLVYLVEGLPGVGPRRARQLLESFGTPADIMRASREELVRVKGIGPKRAQQIWDALNTRYVAD